MAGGKVNPLEWTPSFRVSFVVFVFVGVSLVLEKCLHQVADRLKRNKKVGLCRAVSVTKDELMLLGFISLLLTIFQETVSKWCVKEWRGPAWVPCWEENVQEAKKKELEKDKCGDGEEPFMTYDAMHYMHYFLFILAMMMVVYSCVAFLLSFSQIRSWRKWEDAAHTDDYIREVETATTNEEKLRFAGLRDRHALIHALHEQTLARDVKFWVTSFFLQFFGTFKERDFHTLRMLFIVNHNLNSRFNFYEYMMQSMQEDFASVMGITIPMWVILVVLLNFHVSGAPVFVFLNSLAVLLCVVVGTKLVAIMRILCADSCDGSRLFMRSDPKPTDDLFWRGKPAFLLQLIHLIFFANSLDLTGAIFYFWKFDRNSCFQDKIVVNVFKFGLVLFLLTLSSYVVLPLYALVSQMGSSYRPTLLPETVQTALKVWTEAAKLAIAERGLREDEQ